MQLTKDPFSLKMYSEVRILEGKYSENFVLYGCASKYRSSYNSQTFSLAFLLDRDKRLSTKGVKIGLQSIDCKDPIIPFNEIQVVLQNLSMKTFPLIEKTDLLDFSEASESALLEAGWKPVNFKSIYELNARWWFKEQP